MKIFTGTVKNTKMAKTAVVSVERVIIHPLYKKRFKRDKNYQVHDEVGVKIGDLVKFTASKPYSKTKKWKILEIVSAKGGKSGEAKADLQTNTKPEKAEKITKKKGDSRQ